jgi:hypothetical protein
MAAIDKEAEIALSAYYELALLLDKDAVIAIWMVGGGYQVSTTAR